MVVGGQIVIRPMMYLALSYDHRIVDGKGAVTFLVRVKEALEDPAGASTPAAIGPGSGPEPLGLQA
jgi:pyruvate/2-oxoglutarate dehydrogenase complex dihydrolipoamide acyltransferase (E2) component